jgi:hypothetical protein
MRREARVRFLGGGGAEMRCCYPTKADYAKFAIEISKSIPFVTIINDSANSSANATAYIAQIRLCSFRYIGLLLSESKYPSLCTR